MESGNTLAGIHHITAIAGNPQQNVDFYSGLLGLRLVKKTVNFDDPASYHLYYGDDLGRPGTVMTFFTWPGARCGKVGAGQVGVTSFSIPACSIEYWRSRLGAAGVMVEESPARWGDRVLSFADGDGILLELIGSTDLDERPVWHGGPAPQEHAIHGFHAPTLYVSEIAPSEQVLTALMGFRRVGEEGGRIRFAAGNGLPGGLVDLMARPDLRAVQGVGTVHHIAWRTPNDARELAWQRFLAAQGLGVTEQRDRQYFHSIYYREPGGVLYEIATDEPGFAIDEAPEALGTSLKLPPWLESRREEIEQVLPLLRVPAAVDATETSV